VGEMNERLSQRSFAQGNPYLFNAFHHTFLNIIKFTALILTFFWDYTHLFY